MGALSERTDGRFASCIDMIAEKVRMIDVFVGAAVRD
jgi:hypothetical protein